MIFAGVLAATPVSCGGATHYEPIAASEGTTAGQVKGRVVLHDGRPAAMASVSLYGEQLPAQDGGMHYVNIQADASGNFHFNNVPPGEYEISPGAYAKRQRVEVRAGQATMLTLELPKLDPSQTAKPYGAPPARRRIV